MDHKIIYYLTVGFYCFTMLTFHDNILARKSKGLPEESIKSPYT